MIRKIGLTVLGITGLFATEAFSTNIYPLLQGTSIDYELPSKDPQIFKNFFFWTINARCTIVSDTYQIPITIKTLSGNGKLNGEDLKTGQPPKTLLVSSGDAFKLTASGGAKVELTNQGEQTIKANCTTV